MKQKPLHRVRLPKRKYKAVVKPAEETAEAPATPAKPYRSPRAKLNRTSPPGKGPGFLKLSVAVGILAALIGIKIFDPVGAAYISDAVNTYIGGDDSVVTLSSLGAAITQGETILDVFENLSDVLSGKSQSTPVSNPLESEPSPEPQADFPSILDLPDVSGELEDTDAAANQTNLALAETTAANLREDSELPSRAMSWRTASTQVVTEDQVEGAYGIDDTLPVPYGVDPPDTVDFTYYNLSFPYTKPVTGVTSSGFGYRTHPILGDAIFHYGTDFAVKKNTDILSFADGTVSACGTSSTYGNYILVTHEDGVSTFYAHCQKVVATLGSKVKLGEVIAKVGSTGQSTGPHLHFELRRNGATLNPEHYVSQ